MKLTELAEDLAHEEGIAFHTLSAHQAVTQGLRNIASVLSAVLPEGEVAEEVATKIVDFARELHAIIDEHNPPAEPLSQTTEPVVQTTEPSATPLADPSAPAAPAPVAATPDVAGAPGPAPVNDTAGKVTATSPPEAGVPGPFPGAQPGTPGVLTSDAPAPLSGAESTPADGTSTQPGVDPETA